MSLPTAASASGLSTTAYVNAQSATPAQLIAATNGQARIRGAPVERYFRHSTSCGCNTSALWKTTSGAGISVLSQFLHRWLAEWPHADPQPC